MTRDGEHWHFATLCIHGGRDRHCLSLGYCLLGLGLVATVALLGLGSVLRGRCLKAGESRIVPGIDGKKMTEGILKHLICVL